MESNWRYLVLFLLLVVIPKVSSGYLDAPYVLLRHLPRPWIFEFDKINEEEYKQKLSKPWITVDQSGLIETLANTTGFKIASALLQNKRCRLTSLLLVNEIYRERDGTNLYIPNCDGLTIYIMQLDNEKELLENNPEIIDDIVNGKRQVFKQIIKKVLRFDGGLNLNVSRPFVYSDDQGVVAAHGAKGGFGAIESRVDNLTLYGPYPYDDGSGGRQGLRADGLNYFESVGFPLTGDEEDRISELSMKIEMVIVANIVEFPDDYDPELDEFYRVFVRHNDPEKLKADFILRHMPYKLTMLYALHF